MDEVPGDDGDKDTEEPEALETTRNSAEPNVELYSTVPSTQSEQIYSLAGMTSGTVVVQVAQGDLGADMGDVVLDGGYQGHRR